MGIDISRFEEAIEEIESAKKTGHFLPVLGFELSCLPEYNRIPNKAKFFFKEDESKQLNELARQRQRLNEVEKCFNEKKKKLKEDTNTENEGTNYRQLQDYIQNFSPSGVPCKNKKLTIDPIEQRLVAFLINITELTFHLTRKWSESISDNPCPLGSSFPTPRVEIQSAGDSNAKGSMRRSLKCCAKLWEFTQKNKFEPNSLKIEWVYVKLLRLASETFTGSMIWEDIGEIGDDACSKSCCSLTQDDLCQEDDFSVKRVHEEFIMSHSHEVNWNANFTPQNLHGQPVIRLSHILWLQGLIKHLSLSGTRAYRTRTELAFLLALDDEVYDLPDEIVDPFEIGLLFKSTERDLKTLRELLAYCETGNSQQAKSQPFFHMLALYLKQLRHTLRELKPYDRDAGKNADRQIILSMCLDREMERALACVFSCFRLLIPVTMSGKDGEKDKWLLAECISEKSEELGYVVKSLCDIDDIDDFDPVHEGPLLIKLFGSPLENLPIPDAVDEIYSHRVVLDENKLLTTLKNGIPSSDKLTNLQALFTGNRFFFFGQNAISWSERLPFFMLGTHGGEVKAVAIGKSGVLGSTALRKLDIKHTVGGNAQPGDVIQQFIITVANNDKK